MWCAHCGHLRHIRPPPVTVNRSSTGVARIGYTTWTVPFTATWEKSKMDLSSGGRLTLSYNGIWQEFVHTSASHQGIAQVKHFTAYYLWLIFSLSNRPCSVSKCVFPLQDDETGSYKKVKEAGLDPLSRTSPRDSPRESLIPTTCPSFMKRQLVNSSSFAFLAQLLNTSNALSRFPWRRS